VKLLRNATPSCQSEQTAQSLSNIGTRAGLFLHTHMISSLFQERGYWQTFLQTSHQNWQPVTMKRNVTTSHLYWERKILLTGVS